MKNQMLYRDLAKYYDLIYSWKDYKKEANQIKKLISKYKKSDGKELLEVGCGTGNHLRYLKSSFFCTGVDINQGVLNIAKRKIKRVIFKKEDMLTLNLNKKFDVVISLFSSIGYVKTYANLRRTIKNFGSHLKKGGIVIIEPWFNKSNFKPGVPGMTTYDSKYVKIARVNNSNVKNNISVLDMHYLIGEKGKPIRYFSDRHELGLFDIGKTLEFIKQAGFKPKFLKNGLMKDRGLFIGIKK